MRLRRIKFQIKWDGDRYVPDITNFILDYAVDKSLILIRVRVKKHFDGKSRIWLWCTQSQKIKFARALFEYASKAIEDTTL